MTSATNTLLTDHPSCIAQGQYVIAGRMVNVYMGNVPTTIPRQGRNYKLKGPCGKDLSEAPFKSCLVVNTGLR